jgi:DNA-binding response OmpR family regulator/HPt (histidine-containing phosphotransfer) domain-containing protein
MNQTNRKILIVEDDAIIASIYHNKLENAGFEVEVAPDGQTGFYRIHEARPHAVLLDLMLPHMNGLDILKKIRAQKRFEKMPVFVFTNEYLSEFAAEAAQVGATQVFNKASTTPQQIIEAFNKALFIQPAVPKAPAAPVAPPSPPAMVAMTTPAGPASPWTQPLVPFPATGDPTAAAVSTPMPTSDASLPMPTTVTPTTAHPLAAALAVPPPPPAGVPSFSSEGDAAFQAELLKSFVDSAPETLTALRRLLQGFTQAPDPAVRQGQLQEFYRKVHALPACAAMAGLNQVAQMSAALEALVREMMEKPKNINPSTQRTIGLTIDFLGGLIQHENLGETDDLSKVRVLVVDDEIISRRAVTYALEKVGLKSVAVDEPNVALQMLTENQYDLVFLDVDMPDLDGFELCKRLRALPAHSSTPVVFVTSLSDFDSRAQSTLSGGSDLIGKPFLFIELAVKALGWVLRGRIKPAKT